MGAPTLSVKKTWQLSRHVDAVVSAGSGNAVAATSLLTGSVWDGRVHGLMGEGQIEAEIEVDTGIADLCVLDEGQFIAGCDDGFVRVVHSGGVLALHGGHDSTVMSVAVSREKKFVTSGGSDRAVLCWNLKEPTNEPMRFEGHIDSVNSVDWNNTGDRLLTASSDGLACVWDERDSQWQAAITIPAGLHVYSAVFASKGTNVVLTTEMMEAVAFDIRSPLKPMWRKGGFQGVAHCLRTNPHNENIVAVASNCPAVSLIDVAKAEIVSQSLHHTDYVRSVAWDPKEDSRLFSGSWDKSVTELVVGAS